MPSRSAETVEQPPVPPSLSQFTFWRGLKQRLRDSMARRGFLSTVRNLASEAVEFLRDCLPSRQRQRWGDIGFDCDYRVHTTSARIPIRTRLRGAVAGGGYQPSDPALFHEMLDALSIDYRDFTFIDLGSGKGRALLMASDYSFRRILGVELLRELHHIAEENIAKYRGPEQKCFIIESWCGDALDFVFPPEPIVLYIFNPFSETGLTQVISSLQRSLANNPRPIYVVYHNPVLEHVFSASPVWRRIAGN